MADVKNKPYSSIEFEKTAFEPSRYEPAAYTGAQYVSGAPLKETLIGQINLKDAVIGIVGLGEAGLSLAGELVEAGFKVVGVDLDEEAIEQAKNGGSLTNDELAARMAGMVEQGRLGFFPDYSVLADVDCISICGATSRTRSEDPGITLVTEAVERLLPHLGPGKLVMLEAIIDAQVGAEMVARRIQERLGLETGREIFIAFSSERDISESTEGGTGEAHKMVSGVTPACVEVAHALYSVVYGATDSMSDKTERKEIFVHETAVVDEPAEIGAGTRIWHFCHLMSGCRLGEDCNIGQNVFIASNVVLGRNVKVQNNVSIYEGVELEDDVFIGPSMVFTNISTPRSHVSRRDQYERTVVKKGATLGANATVVCGNTIGQYAFVGAGAVVTRSIPAHALVVGNPARRVGWMCRCGERLSQDLTCPACGERYVPEGDSIRR